METLHQCVCQLLNQSGLFIGTKSAAADLSQLRDARIAHIVNVGGGVCHFEDEVKYLKMGVEDKTDETLELKESTTWIHEALERQEPVLVHCMGCFSRSPAIAIAYLIRFRRLSFDQALQIVKLQRSCAIPNKGFEKQLRSFEAAISRRK
mgnify:CR=1 FL=1